MRSDSLRTRLAVGTALAGAMLAGYGRAMAGTCVSTVNPAICAGPVSPTTDTTQTITFNGTVIQAVTSPGFGINTAAGDAIDLTGSGSFNDQNGSTITGASSGLRALNAGAAALTITTTGTVTGASHFGLYAANTAGTDLTINAAAVIGHTTGLYAFNGGTGATAVTITGAVTGQTVGSTGRESGIGVDVENSAAATGALTINTSQVTGAAGGVTAVDRGKGSISVTATGMVTGTTNNGIQVYNLQGPSATVMVTSTGGAKGAVAGISVSGAQPLPISITNQGLVSNLSGLSTDVAISTTGYGAVTLNNSGTITGVVNLTNETNTVNLSAGSVTGTINTGSGVSTVNFNGGSLTGAINMGGGGQGGNVVNLTNLTSANLSGATHINGGSSGFLTLSNVQYKGGSLTADDTSKGVNLLSGWSAINLDDGTQFTLTGGLSLGIGGLVAIDSSSTLLAGGGVNPTIVGRVDNAGAIDLSNGGVFGNGLTIQGTFRQESTGNLIIGVSPTAIDLVTVTGNTTLGGTVTFAFAPGTYALSRRSFLTSSTLNGSSFATVAATGTPAGFNVAVGYTATDAQLILNMPKCVLGGVSYLCSGAISPTTDTTQTLTYTGPVTSGTTAAGFGISTQNGDAIDINVANGGGTFRDDNSSTIKGAVRGVYVHNTGTGAFALTTSGPVTGLSADGIKALNAASATDLTIKAAAVSGQTYGVNATNNGSGALNVTTTGAVTAATDIGIQAVDGLASTGNLTVNTASVFGTGIGVLAYNRGSGSLSITSSGDVSKADSAVFARTNQLTGYIPNYSLFAINGAAGRDLTVHVASVGAGRMSGGQETTAFTP